MKHVLTTLLVVATASIYAATPYITEVFDFFPGMGQFVNELPKYETGDTKADMIKKVKDAIVKFQEQKA